MFKNRLSSPATPNVESSDPKSCCTKVRACCRHAGRAREVGMTTMTALAMFGPKRFRPYFQHILAVISVVTATVQFFRRRKSV